MQTRDGESSAMPRPQLEDLPPPDFFDPVIEAYKRDVDRTLLRENLKLTVEERLLKLQSFTQAVQELSEAGRKAKAKSCNG
jgi:hypothetical protein